MRIDLCKVLVLFIIALLFYGCGESKLMLNKPKPLSGQWLKVFKLKPADLTAYVAEHPMKLNDVLIKSESISKSTIIGAEFKNTYWDDSFAQNSTISDTVFIGGMIYDTSFADSTLTNVVFENMEMEKAEFINAKLINVKFKNCKIIDSEIRNLRTSKIIFENSELTNVTFFESELDISLKNTKIIEQGEFLSLKSGSKILIENSYIGPYSEFDNSKLLSFKVKNSSFMRAKMNFATIDEINIENSKLNFPIGGGTFNRVILSGIEKSIVLGDSKFNSLSIENCIENVEIILFDTNFKSLSIRNCLIDELDLSGSKGEKLQINATNIGEAKFNNLMVKELILNNVSITKLANFENTIVDDSLLTNFKIKTGTKVKMTGTNIKFQK